MQARLVLASLFAFAAVVAVPATGGKQKPVIKEVKTNKRVKQSPISETLKDVGKIVKKQVESVMEEPSEGDPLPGATNSSQSTPLQVTDSKVTEGMHSKGLKDKSKHQKRAATLEEYLPSPLTILKFMAVVIVSYFSSKGFPYIGLPLVSGYLFCGIIFGPGVLGVVTHPAIRSLRIIDEVSLAFIALAAGAQLHMDKMSARKRSIQLTTVALVTATFLLGTMTLFALRESIDFMDGMSAQQCWAVAMLGGALLVARSPASAIAIKKELGAEGPFTSTVMGTTIIMDVVVIALFALVSLVANGMLSDRGPDPTLLGIFAAQMVISVTLGILVGLAVLPKILFDCSEDVPEENKFMMSIFKHSSYLLVLFLGFVIFFASHALEPFLEPLVTCMAAGCTLSNMTKLRNAFEDFEDRVAPAINALFFTLTGAALSLETLFGPVFVLVLVLFLVRLFAIGVGAYGAGIASGDSRTTSAVAWMAYITQAGVALGLAKKIHVEFETWGGAFATTMVAVVVLNQLIGPPFFRFVIRYVGETGKADVWHANATSLDEDDNETAPLAHAVPESVAHTVPESTVVKGSFHRNESRHRRPVAA
uniref:Cation/H+ exchanger transmembrane domain-containing protein n=2 Tax=Lotharella globosa TaxID=91324 RepID=A0A6V3SV97_9EUKA|mmetsp:Transcript_4822/g.9418  ORF Transcript_4822/g.9418 Transcript_4822/m.9418 type:complete len:592 (+) Transcript_4822:32-1807(+)